MVKLPKCECGAGIGLSFHDDRHWCPDCMWVEIGRLQNELLKARQLFQDQFIAEQAEIERLRKVMLDEADVSEEADANWQAMSQRLREAAEAAGGKDHE